MKTYNIDNVFEKLNSSKDELVVVCQQIINQEMNEDVESVIISCSKDEGFSPSENARDILEIASRLMEIIASISDAKIRNPYIEG